MSEQLSRSEIKRRFKAEEDAAQELSRLTDRDLGALEVGDRLKKEVVNCRGLKGGSLKRQVKFLAKVMREDSVETVLAFLAERKGSKLKSDKLHHEAERIRDALVNEALEDFRVARSEGEVWESDWPGQEIEQLVARLPVDEGDLRKSVYRYVKTRNHSSYKEIFRILKAALEKEQMLA